MGQDGRRHRRDPPSSGVGKLTAQYLNSHPSPLSPVLRTAIVHEWLAAYAGSEKVVEQMLALLPEAAVYSLVDFLPEADRRMLDGRTVHTSFIQRLPFARKKFRGYLALMPLAMEQFDLSP